MTDELVYHVDGELVSASEATVNVRDRGFMYGDAAFETCRVYGGTLFEWDAHAERLGETCDVLSLDHNLTDDDLHARIESTLDANDLWDASVRLSITRGVQPGKLTPGVDVVPTVVVTVSSLPRGGVEGESVWDDLAVVRIVDTQRVPNEAIPARAKTHNYLNGILARLELRGTDADEALMLDREGFLTEGTTSNVFFVTDGTLRTPSLDGPVLSGVTRAVVLGLAREEGIPIEEGRYTPVDLRGADEAFLTNTSGEVWPIRHADDVEFDTGDAGEGGPTTARLAERVDEYVEATCYE